ncbi:RNA 2',3'-cyclic phosphodiesterase [Geomicrobium sp. JSM 1781026]
METHYFFAIPIPRPIGQKIQTVSEQLNVAKYYRQVTHCQDYHITLKFLGGMTDTQFRDLQTFTQKIAEEVAPFDITLSRVEAFGNRETPRVLYVGVDGGLPLVNLQKNVEALSVQAGFRAEQRAYTPHVTLAKRSNGCASDTHLHDETVAERWTVPGFCLYRVNHGQTPRYEQLRQFIFTG